MSVPIRELKASLSRVLLRAQSGEVIEVTSHNRPIARIVGIPAQATGGLRFLIASGAMAWGGKKPNFKPLMELDPRGTPVSKIVLEDRH